MNALGPSGQSDRQVLSRQETMPEIVSRMAQSQPDRIFAYNVAGETLSWRELQSRIELWAGRFVSLGVRSGDIVATLVDSSFDSLASWLALVGLGAVDAATNGEFRDRMLAYAINNCRPALIVVAAHYLGSLDAVAAELQTVKQVLVVNADGASVSAASALPGLVSVNDVPVDASAQERMQTPRWSDIACVTYTSGTTGPSKAVRLPWGQLNCINLGTFPFEDLNDQDVLYCTTSHAHFGAKAIPYLAAMIGGTVVIRSRFSLNSFWADIGQFRVTTGMLVGTMADMLLRSPDRPQDGETSLRNLFMAPLGPCYRQFAERFGVRICTAYNSTEGGVAVRSGWDPSDERTAGRLRPDYPGFEVRIVDEHDFEVPNGTPGECIIRSSAPWVMNAGYLHNAEATADAWRNGWFHTGDALVRDADGNYMFVDRLKDVIRRRGENISSFEVEADVLANSEIVECAAVAVPAETAEDEIFLFAVRRAESSLTVQELVADLQHRMARFMVPRYLEFLPALPKTQATQRVMKAELRRRGLGPQTWDRERSSFVSTKAAL